jgi:integrase
MKMATRRRKGRRTFGATRQLPSGRWQASYPSPDGERRVGPNTFTEAADANSWLAMIEAEILRGDWRPPELAQETFGTYGRRWLDSRVDLRPTTAELYEGLWKRWLQPVFEDVPLGKLTTELVRTWYARMTAEHKGSTQPAKAYRLARAMLNTAVDDGLLRANPCRVKGAGREAAAERPTATPAQVASIASKIDARYRAMVLLAAYGSLRFGELAGLRRRRIDLLHRTVAIEEQAVELAGSRVEFGHPKTEAGRRQVAIPEPVMAVLAAHLDEYVPAHPDALVFSSPEGHPLRRTKFRAKWQAACAAAGIAGLHFHDLRHTGATLAAGTGATVRELMARLGHTTPAVALRYQHATAQRDRAIADQLAALYTAEGGSTPEPVKLSRAAGPGPSGG